MKFEVGDKVVLVKRGAFGWESRDWTLTGGLILDKVYTVTEVGVPSRIYVNNINGPHYCYHPDHFEHFSIRQEHIPKNYNV